MATTFKFVASVAIAALVASSALGCSTFSYNPGSFTDDVPWGCVEPFECFVEFCSCVSGQLSSTCTPFGAVNASTIEQCAARRVTCIMNAALHSRNVWNTSCQGWGDKIASLYATYYSDRTSTNLTDACKADMCGVVTAGNSSLADSVNYTYICSYVGFGFPAPADRNVVAGCAASSQTYFENPPQQCSGANACRQTYCSCVNGTWNTTALSCTLPAAQPMESAMEMCWSAQAGCLTKAALDMYVPGASPLNTDPCLAWAVPIAQDYATYYNATVANATITKESTALWQACNFTACNQIHRYNASANFSSVCTFAAVAGVVPTFVAYNPCPYSCPDSTCAANLAKCACTQKAVVSGLNGTFSRDINNLDMTRTLTGTGFASYGVASGNCSSFDFSTSMSFVWTLTNSSGVVVTVNSSSFSIPGYTMVSGGTYTLRVTATGLVSNQTATTTWTLTPKAPEPTVSITGSGASLRIPNTNALAIKATVVDIISGTFNWSCVATTVNGTTGTCPNLSNSTASALFIASGAAAGTYVITYTYRSVYTSSITLTVVAGEIPYVRIIVPSGPISTNPVAFLNTQQITLTSGLTFSGTVTYNWTVNGGSMLSNSTTLSVMASALNTTSLSAANSGNYVYNTIYVRATSATDMNVFGEATLNVVVLVPFTMMLTVTKQSNAAQTYATALTDKLVFSYSTTPALAASNAPFGASLVASIVYYDFVGGRESALEVQTTPSGAALVGAAPMFSNKSLSSQNVNFGVQLLMSGVLVASGNATFNITKGDVAAATASILATVSSVTDSTQAISSAGTISALMAQTTNTTLLAQMATAALDMIQSNIKNDTVLTATQSVTVVSSISAVLSSSNTTKAAASLQVKAVVTTVITGGSFNIAVADVVADAISNMDSATGGALAIEAAKAVSKAVAVGETKSISMGSIGTMTSTSQTGAALTNLKVTDSSGAAIKLPASLNIPGMSDDAVYGVATAVLTTNPFGGDSPTKGVVTYDITSNGGSLSVANLAEPIVITLPDGTSGVCQYYNEATLSWTDSGVVTVTTTTSVECHTTHLTAFGGFSSASTAVLSVLVLAIVALVQLVVA
jgi:hypothetical protein